MKSFILSFVAFFPKIVCTGDASLPPLLKFELTSLLMSVRSNLKHLLYASNHRSIDGHIRLILLARLKR
jgi:hypothetical protein